MIMVTDMVMDMNMDKDLELRRIMMSSLLFTRPKLHSTQHRCFGKRNGREKTAIGTATALALL